MGALLFIFSKIWFIVPVSLIQFVVKKKSSMCGWLLPSSKSSKLLLIKEQFNRVQHRSEVCQDLWPYMLSP